MNNAGYCICCGGEQKWLAVTSLAKFLFGMHAKILKCSVCGLGKTIPQPSQAGEECYEDNERYVKHFSERTELHRSRAEDLLDKLGSVIEPSGKRLLDVGSGGGFLVEAAQRRGFTAKGMEANAKMVEWCLEKGLDVIKGDVMNLDPNLAYDVVVLSHILEHNPKPDALLAACKKILNPDGVIIVQQAIYDGLLPFVFPWGWYGWQPKEHFWHFTVGSLGQLINRSGLQQVRAIKDSLHHPWFLKGSVKELVGRNIAALIARIGVSIGLGDRFTVILRQASHS